MAVEYMEPGLVDCLASEGRWRKTGDVLRLNPFMKLGSLYRDHLIGEVTGPLAQWDAPDFPNDVRALGFIRRQSENETLPSPIAQKYRSTMPMLVEMLGEDCAAWADAILPEVIAGSPSADSNKIRG